jgi:hypothetical protein
MSASGFPMRQPEVNTGGAGVRLGSLGPAPIDPRFYGRDFIAREAPNVRPLAIFRIRLPGRHLAGQHRLPDSGGPRPRLLVGEQRHGRDIVRMVASGAAPVKMGLHPRN